MRLNVYPTLQSRIRSFVSENKRMNKPTNRAKQSDWPTRAPAEGNQLVGEQFCITQATDECDLILPEKHYHGCLDLVVKGNKALQCINWLQPYIIKEREADEVKSMVALVGTWIRTGPANERTFIMLKAVMDAGTTVPPRGGKTPYKPFSWRQVRRKREGARARETVLAVPLHSNNYPSTIQDTHQGGPAQTTCVSMASLEAHVYTCLWS